MDYPGKVITKTQVTPTQTSASGNWTLDDQAAAIKNNNWPVALVPNPISKSLRFNSADSAYLNRTPATASNRKTWTWSGWVKRSALGAVQFIFGAYDNSSASNSTYTGIGFGSTDTLSVAGWSAAWRTTTQVFRDTSAWYHIVVALDTTQATANNRVKVYVNGVEITAFATTNNPTQNDDLGINATNQHRLGSINYSSPYYFSGYLAEVNFIDGLALTPAYFGFNNSDTGVWSPKQYTGAYGTNGFFLPFNNNVTSFSADFLVIAGGGGSGPDRGGGGGGGGYRTSAGTSGGGASAESQLALIVGTAYTVTVGAGGTASPNNTTVAGNGNNSVLASVTSTGGGGGGGQTVSGATGGSGGGGGGLTGTSGAAGTANQGFAGGNGYGTESGTYLRQGGGGGGAGGAGVTGTSSVRADGGAGVSSSITGSAVSRGGGGGGGLQTNNPATGTAGGGNSGVNGTANTGGGAGGGIDSAAGKTGGSGIVIIKVPNYITASFSGGVTSSLSTSVAGFNIYTVTATSTTSETVTFS